MEKQTIERIGVLLPRSTDYPAMGFDILQGLRSSLEKAVGHPVLLFTESIGFGEDKNVNYARAEKLILQDAADLIIAYCSASNAEALYPLAAASGKPFVFLDAGMTLPSVAPSPGCYHISLQGMQACRSAGFMAGAGSRQVIMATSFYDGGYRGPWFYDRGLSEAGGSVCGNYVSGYKVSEFSIDTYIGLLQQSGATSVAACFSSYLAELFLNELHKRRHEAGGLPVYCGPFMAEEQMLRRCDFPGGELYAVVPWAAALRNDAQQNLVHAVGAQKPPDIFHLLGWEAGLIIAQIEKGGASSLGGFSYESPRGTVHMHPQTHYTYADLHQCKIIAGANGKCALEPTGTIEISADDHFSLMKDQPDGMVSGWKNNYLCI